MEVDDLRFHRTGSADARSHRLLSVRARRISGWGQDGIDVRACFQEDLGGHAPRDAAKLARCLS